LLHVHYAIPHASAAYMAQRILESQGFKIPYITTLHGTDITLVGKDSSFEPVITFAINRSDAVTAVSKSLKNDTCNHFKVENEIEIIPNFVCIDGCDFPEVDKELKKRFAPNGEKIIAHVSNFRKVKRIPDVIAVFEQIRRKMPAKLLLIGDGPELHDAEVSCREKGIFKDVLSMGKLNEIARLLSVADLFLLPSESESFGLAALEAMAVGVPVISSDSGGIPEVNKHGFSGYLAEVGNVNQMAEYALKILSNASELKRFKANAFGQAKKFDLLNILPSYESLYQKLIPTSKEKLL